MHPSYASSFGFAPAIPSSWQEEAAQTITEAMAVFEPASDHAGLAKCWRLLAWTHGAACRFELMAEAHERALEHALLAGDVRQQQPRRVAPTPSRPSSARPRCHRRSTAARRCSCKSPGDRPREGLLLGYLASLHAMEGSFDRARELRGAAARMLEELGLGVEGALVDIEAWRIETLAGDPVAAERELARAYDGLSRPARSSSCSTVAGLLAETHYELQGFDEVESSEAVLAGACRRRRHRHPGSVALRPGQDPGRRGVFDAPRPRCARRSRSSRPPTLSSSSSSPARPRRGLAARGAKRPRLEPSRRRGARRAEGQPGPGRQRPGASWRRRAIVRSCS